MKLNQLTIKEAQEGLKKKKFSSVELTKACLQQIKKYDKKTNAFITVCENEALVRAEEADAKMEKSKDTKHLFNQFPLLGIPLGIKDIYCTKGIKTTAGSRVLADYFPVYDATSVRRLKDAGTVILGKVNLDAWGHGASGENSDFGSTKNPWDFNCVPGGSSSGSGAAVASDMCFAASSTDTGGSSRLPASFCNVVGLKPTYGRVSRYGVIAMASSLDSIGHFAKSVTDAALILGVTAGRDSHDATTLEMAVPDYTQSIEKFKGIKSLKGLKIGIPKEYFQKGIDNRVKAVVEKAINKLENLGAKLISISLPHTQYALAVYYIVQPAEVSSNLARYDGIRYGFPRDKFGDEARRRIMLGTFTLSTGYYEAYYLKAMQVRTLIKEDFDKAFTKVDVIVAPVSPTPPFKLGEKIDDPLKMYLSDVYTVTANLVGIPSLAIPAGFINHLPVGIQILGPQFSEELLFQVGYAYEQATEWHQLKPKL